MFCYLKKRRYICNVNNVIRHIEYLLVEHDCVIVPGFGAFIAHQVGARLSDDGQTMLPPSRTFTFNPTLDRNDGLLVNSVARAMQLGYDAALKTVTGDVEIMHRRLEETRSLTVGAVGELRLDAEGLMYFEPSCCFISPQTMWLPSLSLRPVSVVAGMRAAEAARAEASGERGRFGRYAVRAARVAASLALILALSFVLTTPIDVDNAQYASFGVENFELKTPSNVVDSRNTNLIQMPGDAASQALVLVIGHRSDAATVVDTSSHNAYIRSVAARRQHESVAEIVQTVKSASSEPRFVDDDPYCLIIASLATESEAQKYLSQHPDQKLGILAKDGRYRVFAATGLTSRMTAEAADGLADRFPGAWVCRR